ncbi:hypothetical protein Hypma_006331 [Hypsizygus marmoreus]|uniref:C2H2-type domain-containing protein n=1 Tax=Hypsizygus marmoreus TaxID=39966 RepID=A0A369K0D6_HYPMA|nr:hypothetical protein Hypma_006331 [Hypsizygus marmoreus]
MVPLAFTYSDVQLAQRSIQSFQSLSDITTIDAELRSVANGLPTPVLLESGPRSPDLFDNPFIPNTPCSWEYRDFDLVKKDGELKYDIDPTVWKFHRAKEGPCVSAKALGWDGSHGAKCTTRLWRPTLDEFLFNGDTDPNSDSGTKPTKPSFKATTSPKKLASLPKSPPSRGGTCRPSTQSPNRSSPPRSTPLKRKPTSQPEPKPSKLIIMTKETRKRKPRAGLPLSATAFSDEPKRFHPCGLNGCTHVCFSEGDLYRHRLAVKHKEPSVPCPKACGAMFTRPDSAKRHLVAVLDS